MADTSPYAGIPLLTSGQSDPQITHNEAIVLIQALLNGVIDKDLTAPPGSPAEGDTYIVGASATGAWAGQDDHLATYYNGAWLFLPGNDDASANLTIGANNEGLSVFVRDEEIRYTYTGSPLAWTKEDTLLNISEMLTADRTYYVDGTNGSDSNDGLSTGAGAFATIQKAVDVASGLIIGAQTVTISVADDTYSENVTLGAIPSGKIIIEGNTSTPANCIISGGSSACVQAAGTYGQWAIRGFRLNGTNFGLQANGGGLEFDFIDFNNTGNHIDARNFGVLDKIDGASQTYTISAGAAHHVRAASSSFINISGANVTVGASLTFSTAFARARFASVLVANSITFSTTTATGTRYDIDGNGVIHTGGGGANYFPGNAAGTTATGGQYL